MRRFHYGICEWSLLERGKDLCKLVSEAGFTHVSLGIGTETLSGGGLANPSRMEEYLSSKEKYGLTYSSTALTALDHYSYCNPTSVSEEETACQLIDFAIDCAEKLGCRSYLLPAFHRSAITDSGSFTRAVKIMKKSCERAAEKGIYTYFESPLSAEKVIDVLEAVDHPMFKVYFDSQNNYLVDDTNMAELFRQLAPWVGEIHVKDGIGKALSGALLGEGTSGFLETAQAILESEFEGTIVVENYYYLPPLSERGEYLDLIKTDFATMQHVFDER